MMQRVSVPYDGHPCCTERDGFRQQTGQPVCLRWKDAFLNKQCCIIFALIVILTFDLKM